MSTCDQSLISFLWTLVLIPYWCAMAWLTELKDYFFPSYKDLSNDVVLITGAASGIGRLMCLDFGKLTSKVVAWDIDAGGLDGTAELFREQTGQHLFTYTVDLTSSEDVRQTAKHVLSEVGRVTILVNNAGVVTSSDVIDLTEDDIQDCFGVNVLSHFDTIKAFLPSMLGRNAAGGSPKVDSPPRGHIVNVSSIAAHLPCPGIAHYCAAKAASSALNETLSLELWRRGLEKKIYVTNIYPFFINTEMFAGCQPSYPFFFTILDAQDVSDRIVLSVRRNERFVFIGTAMKLLAIVKLILPYSALIKLFKVAGLDLLSVQHRKKKIN